MAKPLVQLSLFVSGTSETDADKAALRKVIEVLNRVLEKSSAVTIRVIGWPDDIRPGVNTDAQAEINRQLGSNYDIYVGILGARFGTPTPRAGSGTEEEFEAALTRFRSDPAKVRLLFYFKRSPQDPFTLNLSQLQKVTGFREQLFDKGVLSRDFIDTTEFVEMVRSHLHDLIVDEWDGTGWKSVIPPADDTDTAPNGSTPSPPGNTGPHLIPPSAASSDDAFDDDEFGSLDYIAAFHEAVEPLVTAMTNISAHTDRLNAQLHASTAESNSLVQGREREKQIGGSRVQQQYVSNAKAIVNRAADVLETYADAMAQELERYRTYSRSLFTNLDLGTTREIGTITQSQQVNEDAAALENLLGQWITLRDNISSVESVIRKIPGLTGKLKRARRRVATQLGEFIADVSFAIDKSNAILARWKGGQAE